MKKLLLASSILAGTAGFAAADITLSGDARMGILNDFVMGAGDDKTGFTSRFRIAFTATGASDNGLEFGAFVRLHQGAQAEQGTKGYVWVSGAFGKITMGDIDSAALVSVGGDINGVGLTGLGDHNELVYFGQEAGSLNGVNPALFSDLTAANSAVLYEYAANGFGFAASLSNPRTVAVGGLDYTSYAVGGSYAFDAYKFGIGYEKLDGDLANGFTQIEYSQFVIGADAEFGQILLQARYADGERKQAGVKENDFTQYSVGATYTADALSVTAYVARKQIETLAGANVYKTDAYGLGASYDLGGGASVVGGIVNRKETDGALPSVKDTAFDLGLSFTF